ncbi:MAG: efflux RND transporter periplasmic adaptor subunit [Bacteroidetes Order II. Incertae sedis bacterium]|jgi:HlyD family secretion protein|nr:efflux RND transporter periplasmic adaptor subunit [Bacteroidetes Order II. bacterium]MBT4603760.1 efflux RND transporter periplasmic adaptor subunit [Bacteroidetes Order II. bacterium]MBT5250443.1 efflux RND transporter periplasmic adaptor subunit [Bacteroidetes Order II. bacterium]MBT6199785.1 efflux RND transporter periplasmic adaptor subunit [Bacteroidetes Order II. bacterium]MBT6424640.1 efflux RND transporter periplasmic adaptor subunit [Bacteroidetes Order II. bacterium]
MAKKKNATKRILIFVGILIILAVVLGVVVNATGLVGSKEKATKIEFGDVEVRTITQMVTASGNIQPEIEVKISPDVSGEIVELPIVEGDNVKRGQLLARIKPDFYQAQVDQSEASVLQSKANEAQRRADLMNAELELNRQKSLYESGAISESAYQTASTRFETMKASYEASQYSVKIAEARLKEMKENLAKTIIYAPMDGTISILAVELGERVVGTSQMTGTEMMRVAKLNQMELEVDVNENDVVNVALGDTAAVEVDAYPNRMFKGIVTEIANSARVQGQGTQNQITNFPVKIRILDPHNIIFDESGADDVFDNAELPVASADMPNFRPGMSGTVDVFTHTIPDATTVPIQAVTVRDFAQYDVDEEGNVTEKDKRSADSGSAEEEDLRRIVFLIDGDRTRVVEVETGIADDSHIVILSGVSVNDQVVLGPYRAVSRTLKPDVLVEEQESRRANTEQE